MNKTFKLTVCVALLSALLTGCASNTAFQRPDTAMPTNWDRAITAKGEQTASISADWWQQFGSAELNQLMTQAMAANRDLAAALARIHQARASADMVSADRLPSATLSGNATSSRSDQASATSSADSQLGVTVAYELDLWGGKAASAQAAQARVDASVYDHDAMVLILQADVAANYFSALALKDRLALARKNLGAAREILSLVELRYNKGAATGLEVSQQRTAVLNNEAQIPQLEQALRTTQTALAVLLGKVPQGFVIDGNSLSGLNLPAVAPYQPTALLERRPDIKRMEAQLFAANADVDRARAALYPKIGLSASAVATGVLTSGSGLLGSLVVSLTQTLFDGGRLRGQVVLSQAQRAELAENYLQSVLVSMKEVQDSLGAVESAQSQQRLLSDAAREAQEAYRIATVKYQAGAQDMLTLLDSQRTQLQVEDSRIQAELARFTSTIDLYKSLGGGWQKQSV